MAPDQLHHVRLIIHHQHGRLQSHGVTMGSKRINEDTVTPGLHSRTGLASTWSRATALSLRTGAQPRAQLAIAPLAKTEAVAPPFHRNSMPVM